jgi:hypothetical protein
LEQTPRRCSALRLDKPSSAVSEIDLTNGAKTCIFNPDGVFGIHSPFDHVVPPVSNGETGYGFGM